MKLHAEKQKVLRELMERQSEEQKTQEQPEELKELRRQNEEQNSSRQPAMEYRGKGASTHEINILKSMISLYAVATMRVRDSQTTMQEKQISRRRHMSREVPWERHQGADILGEKYQ